MYRSQHQNSTDARRGVILMVVLALLTLFAIVGLSFVFYAQAAADASRAAKDADALRYPDESPDKLMAFFLSQLIYDCDDTEGVYSALRGHSLARSMYGFDDLRDPNTGALIPNTVPFNGTGRLATPPPPFAQAPTLPPGIPFSDAVLINYTYYQNDGFLRDPERLGARANLAAQRGLVTGGINVPYTYPDPNNMFMGAVTAGGQVLMPSFHRPWLFGPLAEPNPNWWGNAVGKYLTLRPRPVEQVTQTQVNTWNALFPPQAVPPLPWNLDTLTPAQQTNVRALINYFQQQGTPGLFPYPEDATGDVKNLYWLPGGNDSIWTDLGYPVQVNADGKKYKPMFAFFIMDLDSRVNLNAHGNYRAQVPNPFNAMQMIPGQASNQGHTKCEVNVGTYILTKADPGGGNPFPEWINLFRGKGAPGQPNPGAIIRGRYGWDPPQQQPPAPYSPFPPFPVPNFTPTLVGWGSNISNPGSFAHVYGQADLDGTDDLNGWVPSSPLRLPGQGGYGPYNCFPFFPGSLGAGSPGGWGNGSDVERANHPLIYDYYRPFMDVAQQSGGPVAPDYRPPADDRAFAALEMKALLDGGSPTVSSPLGQLLYYNLSDPLDVAGCLKRRFLVTTTSNDVGRTGVMPWMYNTDIPGQTPGTYAYAAQILAPFPGEDPIYSPAPHGNPQNFPNPATLRGQALPLRSEFYVPGADPASPNPQVQAAFLQSNWRSGLSAMPPLMPPLPVAGPQQGPQNAQQSLPMQWPLAQQLVPMLGRLNLHRPLTAYPASQPGFVVNRFDDNQTAYPGDPQGRTIFQVFQAAQNDRQNMARDIYRLLRKLCAIATPADPTNPTAAELLPRRWLAQLAVNIVDYIDNDDISTPFNFYPADEFPGLTPNPPAVQPPNTPEITGVMQFFVFGVELPRIVLNEALIEYKNQVPQGQTGKFQVNLYAELFNTMPALTPGTWDPTDPNPILLAVPPNAGNMTQVPYAPYQLVVANTRLAAAGGPLLPRSNLAAPPLYLNDNVLGTPDTIRTNSVNIAPFNCQTDAGNPGQIAFLGSVYSVQAGALGAAVPAALAPQSFLIIGAGTNTNPGGFKDYHGTAIPPQNPSPNTLACPTQALSYTVNVDTLGNRTPDDRVTGNTILLRRLANPRYPPDPNPASPTFNPYVTVDFMDGLPLNDATTQYYSSLGKLQPYAADASQRVPQGAATPPSNPPNTGLTSTTFGQVNQQPNPTPPGMYTPPPPYGTIPLQNPFDWLVHLDRQVASPMELLQVCGYHPHELTHRFITVGGKFNHLAPWFDQTTRLYRLFEFIEAGDRSYGISQNGRRPGKININTVWDPEIFQSLCDPQQCNYFQAADVLAVWQNLVNGRNPLAAAGTVIGPYDRPFLGMGVGHIPGPIPNPGTPPPVMTPQDSFYPNGLGINDTFLRVAGIETQLPQYWQQTPVTDPTGQGLPNLPRLFEPPNPPPTRTHPYLRFEMLSKIYNNLTTRSNVFAVWCTVGYFEVTDDTVKPVKLGREIGKAEGVNVRHRFFSIIDRTNLAIAPSLPLVPAAAIAIQGTQLFQVNWTSQLVTYNYVPNPGGGPPLANEIDGILPSSYPGRPNVSWTIKPGTLLVIDRGTINEETVVVEDMGPPPGGMAPYTSAIVRATFIRQHGANFTITIPGNPGPQPTTDPRIFLNDPVVPVAIAVK